ncbi:MAG: hypothetical protein ACRDTE_23610, partial [Pseudonocardiaceae bacterium]
MRKGIADVVRVVGGGRDWLRKLVGGDWDMVFVFPGDLSEDFVEDTVNAKIEYRPEFYTSDNSGIVVFTKRGVVQR